MVLDVSVVRFEESGHTDVVHLLGTIAHPSKHRFFVEVIIRCLSNQIL